MFDILGNLTKAVLNTALLPVDVVRDVGSAMRGDDAECTEKRVDNIVKSIEKAVDPEE